MPADANHTTHHTAATWQLCSERCLTLFLPKPVTLEQQQLCWYWAEAIPALTGVGQWVAETVVGMNTLSVYTHALSTAELRQLHHALQDFTDHTRTPKQLDGQHIKIPVRYGGEYGPDLAAAAALKNLSIGELVTQHTQPIYTVYFIGFQPGFPYLGGLPATLHMARHATPRKQVPAGSVGIGGEQTGIYPFASPGGWQLLGRTDLPLFDITKPQPTLLKAGDTLQFVAVEVID